MTHPTDALRLVPCPFCGADPGVSKYEVDDETTKWAAGCDGSGAPESWVYVEHYVNFHADTKADVIAAWNRRAAPASPLPEGGGQLSKNLGQLKSGQCSGISGELSGWKDISTAPKDGTPLLAGSIHHSDREVVCWQDGLPSGSMVGVMNPDAPEEGWVNEGPHKDRFYANPRYFTHWMPLPAAPTGAK